ncbi:exodeoxyribonuclease V subunit alpha [Alteromonas lipolytica]|uniref:RecBCD enzyme subunit RecD n=1 Tax=Alteromonas lipolytica TaxID=1856405 RepID=A0A1E8FHE4_9ALTE|nr:exodeoxyribonuclease V subunit alpha [Alteromonas lipolytica]OFI34883.1 exodeoxyribonuclease V subunit alpha [Alteromonas lipolytica]GGF54814.1 hypothetical protein GCM10011338_03750 [Alteromonas lipolytica]
MMFTDYNQCAAQLADIEAIDYFFAREIAQLTQSDNDTAFMLLLALSQAQRMGNSCLLLSELAGQRRFDRADEDESGFIFAAQDVLAEQAQLLCANEKLAGKLRYHDGRLYTARYWQFEQELVGRIAERMTPLALTAEQMSRLTALWPALFDVTARSTQDWQQVATALCVNRVFAMLSGGPGTGKTYTIARLLMALQVAWQGELNIVLTAPTGKAAQRLTESVAAALAQFADEPALAGYARSLTQPAMTLHRLLGMPRWGIQSRFNQHNPLVADVVIVDESSMIDLALMTRLFRALGKDTRVLLVGDPMQLPSVEAGNVLGDIIAAFATDSDDVVDSASQKQLHALCPHLPALAVQQELTHPTVHFELKQAQRFSGQLADVASAVNLGSIEAIWPSLPELNAAQSQQVDGVAQCGFNVIGQAFNTLARQWFGSIASAESLTAAMAQLQAVRWLTPFRQGDWGADVLNQRLEKLLAPGEQRGFYRGRPIMITENHHGQRLYNGDVGLIWPDEAGVLKAWFAGADNQYRAIPIMRLPRHETVYAMTIHKSQGSEFAHLLLFIPEAPSKQAAQIYSRELIYTGLTRAKQGAVLVTHQAALQAVVARRQQRKTGLVNKLSVINR